MIFVKGKKIIALFLGIVAILTSGLFMSSKTTGANAAFSGYSPNLTPAELHAATIANSVNPDSPGITFLTHGLGGTAGHWSNGMHRNGKKWEGAQSFTYDSTSIIEKIRNQRPGGIKLFVARMSNSVNSFDTANFTLQRYGLDSENNPTAYRVLSSDVKSISDFSQHTIVVFNLLNNYDKTNAEIYKELDYIIDKISYDYLAVMGALPKINLIGHSRGGLHNMDYAIEHPKNVASLISLGTPYTGSWYDNPIVELLGINDFSSVGGADIVNTTLINERKSNWNRVYAQNTHINFHTISGTTSLGLMNHIIWDHSHLSAHLGFWPMVGIRYAYLSWPFIVNGALALLPGDVCVDKSSQEASGFNGLTNHRYNKEFTPSNSNCDKRSMHQLPVPHNLETYDSDIHDYILDNIDLDLTYNPTKSITVKADIPVGGVLNDNTPTWLYKFVAPATASYSFESSNALNAYATLYDTNNLLIAADVNGSPMDFTIYYDLTAGQTVFLKVQGYYSGTPGRYTLTVTRTIPIIVLDSTYAVTLDANQVKWYKFTAPMIGNYTFSSSNGMNAYAALYDSDNVLIAEDINGSPMDFTIYRELYKGQTVYLRASGYYDGMGPRFNLTVTRNIASLSLDSSYNGNIYVGQTAWFEFAAPEKGRYSFTSVGNNINTYVQLYDGNSNLIAEDINGSPIDFFINYSLNKGQTVYLRIKNVISSNAGNYSFVVTRDYFSDTVLTTDYGFGNEYCTEETAEDIATASGLEISTNRLRCGYITYDQNKYLTLSANKKGAGTAFLEYTFDQDIKSVDLGIALWSATENITDKSAEILFQYKNSVGEWVTKHAFSIAEMSKSKDVLDEHYFEFGFKVNSIRIYVTTTNTGGDSNKGRVVLGDLNVDLYV